MILRGKPSYNKLSHYDIVKSGTLGLEKELSKLSLTEQQKSILNNIENKKPNTIKQITDGYIIYDLSVWLYQLSLQVLDLEKIIDGSIEVKYLQSKSPLIKSYPRYSNKSIDTYYENVGVAVETIKEYRERIALCDYELKSLAGWWKERLLLQGIDYLDKEEYGGRLHERGGSWEIWMVLEVRTGGVDQDGSGVTVRCCDDGREGTTPNNRSGNDYYFPACCGKIVSTI